tara:strand:- start:922 stop:1152 length:231 start_codon:yes stop_codon:yes gene_type:complete
MPEPVETSYLSGNTLRYFDGPGMSGNEEAISKDYFYRGSYRGQVRQSNSRGRFAIQPVYYIKLAEFAEVPQPEPPE